MQNKLLKFLIECNGSGHVLVSNPCLLNILCSAFVTSQNQVVLNIDCEKDVKVLILTKNEESEQVLLKSFSSGEVFRSLFVINECFNDISILGLKLVEIGFLLDIGDKDFESIKSEVDIFLTKNTTYSACSQVCTIRNNFLTFLSIVLLYIIIVNSLSKFRSKWIFLKKPLIFQLCLKLFCSFDLKSI